MHFLYKSRKYIQLSKLYFKVLKLATNKLQVILFTILTFNVPLTFIEIANYPTIK